MEDKGKQMENDLKEILENMVTPTDAAQRKALDTLTDAVKAGNKDAKTAVIEILFSGVQSAFKTHFLPFNNLVRPEKKLTNVTSHSIQVKVEHRLLFNPMSSPAAAIEEAHHATLAGFLVQGERVVIVRDVGVQEAIWSASSQGVTPDEMWATLVKLGSRPVCLWAGRSIMHAMLRKPEWKGIFAECERTEDLLNGVFGTSFGMTCCTDAFRYDTMQTLNRDEWAVFPVNGKTGVEWEWKETVYAEDHVLFSAEIRTGMVQDDG